MTLVRSNDRDRGLAEMETALKGIHEWLENLASDSSAGDYWDTNKQIRKSIEGGLAGKLYDSGNFLRLLCLGERAKRKEHGAKSKDLEFFLHLFLSVSISLSLDTRPFSLDDLVSSHDNRKL
jgi:hypothetical protein